MKLVPSKSSRSSALATLFVLVVAALGVAVSAEAVPATPPAVVKAIQKWDPKAQDVVNVEADFAQILDALPKAQAACEQPLARGPLADALSRGLAPLLTDTHFAEQGELALYPLSRLFSTHAAKSQYVAALDAAGKQFDALLKFSGLVQDLSHLISSGDCSTAMGLASIDAATLHNTVRALVTALTGLRLGYGV